ncbi:unnamed protein product [Aphanomyces euteiches]
MMAQQRALGQGSMDLVDTASTYRTKKTVAFAHECAISFAKDCLQWNQRVRTMVQRESSIYCELNRETKQYFVHSTIELYAQMDDVLGVFTPTKNTKTDPFFSRVFDAPVAVSVVVEDLANERESMTSNQQLSTRTSRSLQFTSVKRLSFSEKPWKKELLCLEHIEYLSPTAVVRFYESVAGWAAIENAARHSTVNAERHENLTFGFLFESKPPNRLRLTFLGYHSTEGNTNTETCKWLEKVCGSVELIKKIIQRRRLAQETSPPQHSLMHTAARCCRICTKSFHLFRRAHACQICHATVCSKCMRAEDVETGNGLVAPAQVCYLCHHRLKDEKTHAVPRRRRHSSRLSKTIRIPARSSHSPAAANNAPLTDPEVIEFETRRQLLGAAMIPAYRPSHTPPPRPPAPKAPVLCSRCRSAPSIGQCGACSKAFCASCSVVHKVQVGDANVFDLQLCHTCLTKSMEQQPSRATTVEPILLRESYLPEAGLMHTIPLHPQPASNEPQAVPLLELEAPDSQDSLESIDAMVIDDGDNQLEEEQVAGNDEIMAEEQLQMFACLDVGATELHDALCVDAAAALEVANAYVTLIYQGTQVLKGAHGPTIPSQIPSSCALVQAILDAPTSTLLIVPDASADDRFASSLRVTGSEGIRFFCGLALTTSDGHCLGTVSVADTAPRLRMAAVHRNALKDFHDRVVALIEDRLTLALENEQDNKLN